MAGGAVVPKSASMRIGMTVGALSKAKGSEGCDSLFLFVRFVASITADFYVEAFEGVIRPIVIKLNFSCKFLPIFNIGRVTLRASEEFLLRKFVLVNIFVAGVTVICRVEVGAGGGEFFGF